MRTIIPTENQLLVKPVVEDESEGLTIIVPDLAKKDRHQGEIIAMGPGVCSKYTDSPAAPEIGDTIVYRTHSTTEIDVDGEKYLVIPWEGVLVILR